MQNLNDFKPRKDFLICVDSDGCAMDTMNIKHKNCFGPKFVDVYGLSAYREQVQNLWEDINLYTKTRGINRFQALALTLRTIREQNICPLSHEFHNLEKWTEETTALSNSALEAEFAKTGNPQLRLALEWSYAVNDAITALPDGNYSYNGVKEALKQMSCSADIVVVSSANSEALEREWKTCGLTEHLSALFGQEPGTKAYLISKLTEIGGYDKSRVLMVGDAPGDLSAAEKNQIFYYPILAGKEEHSWKELLGEAAERFLSGTFAGEYQDTCIQAFHDNLR